MSKSAQKRLNKIMRERNKVANQIIATHREGPIRKAFVANAHTIARNKIRTDTDGFKYVPPDPMETMKRLMGY